MPSDYLTLADVSLINDQNLADIDVDDLLIDAPLLARLAAVPASNGDVHKYVKTTAAPVVGFRDVNDGREHDKSERTLVTATCKLLDASFTVDTALAPLYGRDNLLGMELEMHLRAAFSKLEKQIIYGTIAGDPGDATGFDGLGDNHNAVGTYVIDAGGSANLTSCWVIRSRPNEMAVVAAHDGRIDVGDAQEQRLDGATGHYMAYATRVQGWYAVQYGSDVSSAVRVANLSTTNTLDDDMIFDAISRFPSSKQPDMVVMNRRSLEQLRKSRTATNTTGSPAPTPESVAGLPIIVTDSLAENETEVL